MISLLRRWACELVGLAVISALIGIDKGFEAALHVLIALLSIAVGTDVVSNVLGLVSKQSGVRIILTLSEVVILVLYYVFLVFAELTGVIYIVAVPSLILGMMLYLRKRNSMRAENEAD